MDNLKENMQFKQINEFEFKKLYGLTFVFESKTLILNQKITSSEIYPIGIIYYENENYYFAPFNEIKNMENIIKSYVKNLP